MTTALVPRPINIEREKRKTLRAEQRAKREDQLFDVLLSPNMVRLAMVAGIIAYSTWATRSSENVGPVQSALAFALPGIGIPLIAADAGIKDKWALGAISAAGVGYVTGQMLVGWGEAGLIPTPGSLWEALKDALPEWLIPG